MMLRFLDDHDVAIRPLHDNEAFPDVSAALRGVGFLQAHPIQPPGLYVPHERTLYLRSISPLVVGHELMHAIDAALGEGAYYSTRDVAIGLAFETASSAMLAMNDPELTSWPFVDESRLRSVDRTMWRIMLEIFERGASSKPR